jgi:3-isopropylmalate/(R)-2-methylmalate dehydratase small subunit
MNALKVISGRAALLPADDIDTDRIIPARFLTTTTRSGLGKYLFADWRNDPSFPVSKGDFDAAAILVAGHNFGCGSSREHAVWALLGHGFKAVVAAGFADIFHANALRNNLVPAVLDPGAHESLVGYLRSNPRSPIELDVEAQSLRFGEGEEAHFPLEPFAKRCITTGVDALGYLLARLGQIETYEAAHPATIDTRGGRS